MQGWEIRSFSAVLGIRDKGLEIRVYVAVFREYDDEARAYVDRVLRHARQHLSKCFRFRDVRGRIRGAAQCFYASKTLHPAAVHPQLCTLATIRVSQGCVREIAGGLCSRGWAFVFRVSCFVFQVSGFGFQVSGFGFRISGFGL